MLQSDAPEPSDSHSARPRRQRRRRPRQGEDLADLEQEGRADPIAMLERVKDLPAHDPLSAARAQGVWATLAVWIPMPSPLRSWFASKPASAAAASPLLGDGAPDAGSIRRKKSSAGKRKSVAKTRRDAESEFALRLQSQVAEFERLQAEQEASVKANILLPEAAPAADPVTSLGGPWDSSSSSALTTRRAGAPMSDDEDDPYNLRELLEATTSSPLESTKPTPFARSSTPPPAVIAARPSLAAALDLGPTPGLILLRSNLQLPPSPTRRDTDPPLLPHVDEPRGRARVRVPRRPSAADDPSQQQKPLPNASHRDPSVHSSVSQVACSSVAHQSQASTAALTPEATAEIEAMKAQLAELKAAFAALQAQYMQVAVPLSSASPPPLPPPPIMGGPPPPPPPPPPPMLMPTPPLILPTSTSRSKPAAASQTPAALNMAQLLNEMKSVQLRPRRADNATRAKTPERMSGATPAALAKSPQDALREALIRRFAQTRRAREASHEEPGPDANGGGDDEWAVGTSASARDQEAEDARKVEAARLGLKRARDQLPTVVEGIPANRVPASVLRRGESSTKLDLDEAGNLRKKAELVPGKDGTFDPRQFLTKRGGVGARKRSPGPVVKQDSAVEEQSQKEHEAVADSPVKKEAEGVV